MRSKVNPRTLTLVGAGHAHLYIIRNAHVFKEKGIPLTVIAPQFFYYSGLAAEFLSGRLTEEQWRIDVKALCSHHGVVFVEGIVTSIDPEYRRIFLENEDSFQFDILSLAYGSVEQSEHSGHQYMFSVKPLSNLLSIKANALEASIETIEVHGAGASAFEIASALSCLTHGEKLVRLHTNQRASSQFSTTALEKIRHSLRRRSIHVIDFSPENETSVPDPSTLRIFATGMNVLPLLGEGLLEVDTNLQIKGYKDIFGAGDCVSFNNAPRIGVIAVRQSPILLSNLYAVATGAAPLKRFKAPSRFLLILNLGVKESVLTWGRVVVQSRLCFYLKQVLDRMWLRKYQIRP